MDGCAVTEFDRRRWADTAMGHRAEEGMHRRAVERTS